jgi:hypothetical protein
MQHKFSTSTKTVTPVGYLRPKPGQLATVTSTGAADPNRPVTQPSCRAGSPPAGRRIAAEPARARGRQAAGSPFSRPGPGVDGQPGRRAGSPDRRSAGPGPGPGSPGSRVSGSGAGSPFSRRGGSADRAPGLRFAAGQPGRPARPRSRHWATPPGPT